MSYFRSTTTVTLAVLALACRDDSTPPLVGSEPEGSDQPEAGSSADAPTRFDAGLQGHAESGVADAGRGAAEAGAPDLDASPEVPPSPEPLRSIHVGRFFPLGEADDPGGVAQLLRTATDTVVQVQLSGLRPDGTHRVVVHSRPCEFGVGGETYAIEPGADRSNVRNQLSVGVEARRDGVGVGQWRLRGHVARGDAQALVVRSPQGSAIACADLTVPGESAHYSGQFHESAEVNGSDVEISGEVDVKVSFGSGGTRMEVELSGLLEATKYSAVVHDLPCDVNEAGEPYLRDPEAPAGGDNWVTLDVESDADGDAIASSVLDGDPLRSDAQALMLLSGKDAIACATFQRGDWPSIVTRGTLLPRAQAVSRDGGVASSSATPGLPSIDGGTGNAVDITRDAGDTDAAALASGSRPTGSAEVTRDLAGVTTLAVEATGLLPNNSYVVSASERPCTMEGAGHYLINPPAGDTLENRLELRFDSDAEGRWQASVGFSHTARPEAQAWWLEDGDGTVVGCIDTD